MRNFQLSGENNLVTALRVAGANRWANLALELSNVRVLVDGETRILDLADAVPILGRGSLGIAGKAPPGLGLSIGALPQASGVYRLRGRLEA